jgi:mannose-6-phosphate isomerase-like protein (cupin superfamily)
MLKNKSNTEQFTWGNNCKGWRLVSEPGMSVIEEEMPPRTEEKKHFHKEAQQFFYVKSGIARFEVDDSAFIVEQNEGLYIKPGSIHKISNLTDIPLKFIVISQPSTSNDRVEV